MTVAEAARRFVSRGGDKLDAALDVFGIDVAGVVALDAGASTGGFTDCLLSRGARHVIAADVAYGQLDWRLRTDPRVTVMERTNVRSLDLEEPVDLVVADLSFISLATVADALVGAAREHAPLVLLVKPQFEAPRSSVPRGGVVTDTLVWRSAVRSVVDAYRARGCGLRGVAPSPLPGPKGNREFFVHLVRGGDGDGRDDAIDRAIEAAP